MAQEAAPTPALAAGPALKVPALMLSAKSVQAAGDSGRLTEVCLCKLQSRSNRCRCQQSPDRGPAVLFSHARRP
jgi:hypothetical protein